MTIHPPKLDRNMSVVAMRNLGEPWSAIAKAHGISVATARGVYTRYRARLHHKPAGRYGWVPEEPRR